MIALPAGLGAGRVRVGQEPVVRGAGDDDRQEGVDEAREPESQATMREVAENRKPR